MSIESRLMTTEELLALPDDGVDRELICGELREKPMTTRSRAHSFVMTNLAGVLWAWARQQPRPRGRVYTGDARIRLRRDPDTFVGADLAYLSPEQEARCAPESLIIDEPPTLVVEILSPSDTMEDVAEKRGAYLSAGVAIYWKVDPFDQTVTVHRPGAPPEAFNVTQELTAEPHLPGFRVKVSDLFSV